MSNKINTLNGVENEETLNQIFDNEIIVFEDIQGSKIWVNWNGSEFILRAKSMGNDPISLVDLAMQNYYNNAFNYFQSLDDRVKSLWPKNWSFGFEYFPDQQPANIEYQKVPKNGLVLTTIYKNGKYSNNLDELNEWSRLLNVDSLPIIFQGKLNSGMKEAILYFLNTSEKDLEYVFGEKSFAFFFYKLLNPTIETSFLMDDDFQKNLEKIVIQVPNKNLTFEILNPLYQRISSTNSTEFVEIYTLILLNFLTFTQSIDWNSLKLKSTRKDELYLELICNLFNIYISEVKDDLVNFEFVIPSFFDKEKFKINKELINNSQTRQYLDESPKLEYIFKVILGSFQQKRKKPIGIFTQGTVDLFNSVVDKISHLLDGKMKKMRELQLTKSNLMDFGDFFEISYDTDADNQVYPDVFDEIQKTSDKKDKGKGIKGGKTK
jgi:hypothetical protein